jgi:hypothetical protein
LRFYVNILVPDIPGIDADYEAAIYKGTESPGGAGRTFFNSAAAPPPRGRRQAQIPKFNPAQIMPVGRVDYRFGRSRTAPEILATWRKMGLRKNELTRVGLEPTTRGLRVRCSTN